MNRLFKRIALGITAFSALFAILFFTLPLPGTIPVLMYHYIDSREVAALESNFVSRESFAWQMAFLKKWNYRVLTIDDYYAIKSGKQKSQGREILITFDDGQRSFLTEAIPVLKRHHLPATMFLISETVKNGGSGNYNDSLSLEEIKALKEISGISFQGHTKTHPHLREIGDEQLREEIQESKKDLEAMLGSPVDFLAYPFGEFNLKAMNAAEKANYKLAFTTAFKKLEEIPEGPYSLTRIKISSSSDNPLVFWYKISGIQSQIKAARQKIKYRL